MKSSKSILRSILSSALSFCFLALFTGALQGAQAVPAKPAFSVKTTGHGRPLIFIPGMSSSGEVWDATVAHFSERFECHVLSLAGFAGQPAVQDRLLEQVRDQLADYIEKHHLDHPYIVGHGIGGFVGLWLASTKPSAVGRLVILDCLPFLPASFDPKATPDTVRANAEQFRLIMSDPNTFKKNSLAAIPTLVSSPEEQKRLQAWIEATAPAAAGDAVYTLYTTDLREGLRKITAQSLAIGTWIAYKDYASRGQIENQFKAQFANLHNAKVVMSDARNFIMLDDPKWLFGQLDEFLGDASVK